MKKFFTWLCVILMSEEGFAKLRNNPLGDPTGKLGNFVGGKWKDGIYWLRSRIFPSQKGTIQDYRAYKAGTGKVSFKQMNIRRAVFSVLGYIGRTNLETWIDTIFGDLITRHNITNRTALNLMIKENAGCLFNSIPNNDQEYNATTNAPDLLQLKVSVGDLEPVASITKAEYTAGTGALVVTFSNDHFTNGLDTDKVWVMVAKKPILQSVGVTGNWKPKLYLYGPTRGNSKTRTDATVTVTLPKSLTVADLTCYVFMQDAAGTIGYSDSLAKEVEAPA